MPIINISEYKMAILADIYNNPLIIEAIDSQQTDVFNNEPDSLVYKNIFPYLRIPDTQNKADTYVLLSVNADRINRNNKTYAIYRTTMWALAHMDRMQMPDHYRSTRIDYIGEELKKMFDGGHKFGFSEFELLSNREILLNEKYHYRELVYICRDLRHPVNMLGREGSDG
jgi:hypothetical protein